MVGGVLGAFDRGSRSRFTLPFRAPAFCPVEHRRHFVRNRPARRDRRWSGEIFREYAEPGRESGFRISRPRLANCLGLRRATWRPKLLLNRRWQHRRLLRAAPADASDYPNAAEMKRLYVRKAFGCFWPGAATGGNHSGRARPGGLRLVLLRHARRHGDWRGRCTPSWALGNTCPVLLLTRGGARIF